MHEHECSRLICSVWQQRRKFPSFTDIPLRRQTALLTGIHWHNLPRKSLPPPPPPVTLSHHHNGTLIYFIYLLAGGLGVSFCFAGGEERLRRGKEVTSPLFLCSCFGLKRILKTIEFQSPASQETQTGQHAVPRLPNGCRQRWWELPAAVPLEGWGRFPRQQGQGRRKPPTVKKNSAALMLGSPSRQEEQPCSHPPLKTLSPTCCSCSTSRRTLDELCPSCPPLSLTLFKDKRSCLKKESTKIMFWRNHALLSAPSNLCLFARSLITFINATKENPNSFVLL